MDSGASLNIPIEMPMFIPMKPDSEYTEYVSFVKAEMKAIETALAIPESIFKLSENSNVSRWSGGRVMSGELKRVNMERSGNEIKMETNIAGCGVPVRAATFSNH